jgi:hypothetical protein
MNSEEQKKKELEKRGEDNNSGSGEVPGSGKEQRKDTEPAKEGESDVQNTAQTTEGLDTSRTTGSTPNDQAGVADIDRGMDRAKE